MRLEFAGSDPGRCCIGMPWILARRRLQEPSRMRLRRKTQRSHSWARSRPAKRSCPIWSLSGKRYSFLEPSPSQTTLARTVRQKASAPATPVSPTTTVHAEMPQDLRTPMQKQPAAQLEYSPKRTSTGLRRAFEAIYEKGDGIATVEPLQNRLAESEDRDADLRVPVQERGKRVGYPNGMPQREDT